MCILSFFSFFRFVSFSVCVVCAFKIRQKNSVQFQSTSFFWNNIFRMRKWFLKFNLIKKQEFIFDVQGICHKVLENECLFFPNFLSLLFFLCLIFIFSFFLDCFFRLFFLYISRWNRWGVFFFFSYFRKFCFQKWKMKSFFLVRQKILKSSWQTFLWNLRWKRSCDDVFFSVCFSKMKIAIFFFGFGKKIQKIILRSAREN